MPDDAPLKGEIVPHGAPMGRPSSYTKDIGDTICVRLSLGESLREICRDDDMPGQSTIYRWLLDDKLAEFREQYARAREFQADSLFEEMKEIADDGSNDWMEKFDKDGNSIGWQLNGEAVQRSKLRLEDRRWRAGKLKPKKYGEKIDVTSGGERLTEIDDTARAARIAALMAEAKKRAVAAGDDPAEFGI